MKKLTLALFACSLLVNFSCQQDDTDTVTADSGKTSRSNEKEVATISLEGKSYTKTNVTNSFTVIQEGVSSDILPMPVIPIIPVLEFDPFETLYFEKDGVLNSLPTGDILESGSYTIDGDTVEISIGNESLTLILAQDESTLTDKEDQTTVWILNEEVEENPFVSQCLSMDCASIIPIPAI